MVFALWLSGKLRTSNVLLSGTIYASQFLEELRTTTGKQIWDPKWRHFCDGMKSWILVGYIKQFAYFNQFLKGKSDFLIIY